MTTPLSRLTLGTPTPIPRLLVMAEAAPLQPAAQPAPVDTLVSAKGLLQEPALAPRSHFLVRSMNFLLYPVKLVLSLPGRIFSRQDIHASESSAQANEPLAHVVALPPTSSQETAQTLAEPLPERAPASAAESLDSTPASSSTNSTYIDMDAGLTAVIREAFFRQNIRPSEEEEQSLEEQLIEMIINRMLQSVSQTGEDQELEENYFVEWAIKDFKAATIGRHSIKRIPTCVQTAVQQHPNDLNAAMNALLTKPMMKQLVQNWEISLESKNSAMSVATTEAASATPAVSNVSAPALAMTEG